MTQVYIGGDKEYKPFMTNSAETASEIVSEVVQMVPEGPSLQSVEINYYYDKHSLRQEAVDQLD